MPTSPTAESLQGADEDPAAALIRRWQQDEDHDALDELLRLEVSILKARIRHHGRGMVGASASVSDIAQQVVLRFLEVQTAPRFDNPRALRGYLWQAAWRLLIDRVRRAGRGTLSLDAQDSRGLGDSLAASGNLGAVEQHERDVALHLALQLLRPAEQEILRLVYFEQIGIDGAAQRLGVAHEAAKMRLVRARRSLAVKLADWADLIG